ncbi:hypothetical protein KKE33_00900 [Patescibacteria group bacterium]|nr:hypothetical protein [Patescibacteria group bacterium]
MEFLDITSFLESAGTNPFGAMWFLFSHGGWIVFIILIIWIAKEIWLSHVVSKDVAKKEWMLLSISIPRMTEQTPRAVENIFAHFAGSHSPASGMEKWFHGKKQETISMEIVSIGGNVQFIIRTIRGFRDLIEASIYAQYPDAEIAEVEDYTNNVPAVYPDPEWDLFGVEMIPVKPDIYPIRTYPEFEDRVSGEFKDPQAVLLESFSRLGPGEQAWYQIVLLPIEQQAFRTKAEGYVKKLMGEPIPVKVSVIEKILSAPFQLLKIILETASIIPSDAPGDKKEDNPFAAKIMRMSPGERKVVEAVENKNSKIVYLCKIRFVYVAKKEVMQKKRIVHPFIGYMKQHNTNDMQSLKPESKRVGMNGTLIFFKDKRNNARKCRLINAYKTRSDWVGTPVFHMNIEELATLWHFPITGQVKAPQLQKTEAKRSEPPANLPFG